MLRGLLGQPPAPTICKELEMVTVRTELLTINRGDHTAALPNIQSRGIFT